VPLEAAQQSAAQMQNSTAPDAKSLVKEPFATATSALKKAAQSAPKARCASATPTKTALPVKAKSVVPLVHVPQQMMLFSRRRQDHAVMLTVLPAKIATRLFADLETTGPNGVHVL